MGTMLAETCTALHIKCCSFLCRKYTKIAPLSNATFVPFDSYMKHGELLHSICNSCTDPLFGHFFAYEARPREASLLHAVFNLDSPLLNFREEQVCGNISLL